jgi:Domain of unknown function (DUF4203)
MDPTAMSFLSLACAGLIAFMFGLALCFVGYKFFLFLLPIWGFFFGLWLGAQSMQALFGEAFLATITSWVVGFIVGAIFAVLAYLFYIVAVAIIAGSLGYFVAVGILLWIGLNTPFLVWLIGIIAAIALAVVTLMFNLQKWVIIIATSILGASVVIGTFVVMFNPAVALLENPIKFILSQSWWLWLTAVVLAVVGIVVQFRSSQAVKLEEYNRWE